MHLESNTLRALSVVLALLLFLGAGCIGGSSHSSGDVNYDADKDATTSTGDVSGDAMPDLITDFDDDTPLPDGVDCLEGMARCADDNMSIEVCTRDGIFGSNIACPNGCSAGKCLTDATPGSCPLALDLSMGTAITGNTTDAILSSHVWSEACTASYGDATSGPELWYSLDVPYTTAAEITLDPTSATYFGVYLRGNCSDPKTEVERACDGNLGVTTPFVIPTILAKGQYYVAVDDFADSGNGPGAFELRVDEVITPTCHGQVPGLLDLSSGMANATGNTANGSSGTRWQTYDCPFNLDTVGNEMIYAFALRTPGRVRATVVATAPDTSKVGLYLRTECEERYSQIQCAYDDGTGRDASFTADLPAGAYYLFVDDLASTQDEPQEYELLVELL